MIFGFLPSLCATLRIAARSASSGTPVKSCSTMRATTNGISFDARSVGPPVGQLPDVLLGHLLAVAVAQHRLQHDADGYRQARHLADTGFFQRRQGIELAGFAGADLELPQGVEDVETHCFLPFG